MTRVGTFTLDRPVGRGGMGEVWRATHGARKLPVAIKLLTVQTAQQETFLRSFRNEVRAVAGLDHPHIVRVFDHGLTDAEAERASERKIRAGTPYLAMELVSDGTLLDLRGQANWRQVRAVARGLLDALAHAHARGVIHRDLKPGNVLLGRIPGASQRSDVQVKLTDFGLAHALEGLPTDDDPLMTISGTPAYMAPEQFRGDWRDFGPWTDLYALGCMLWTLVTGEPLFGPTASVHARALAHIQRPIPPLQSTMNLPDGFEDWLRTLLAKRPEHRFQRAADAAWALLQLPEGDIDLTDAGWRGGDVDQPTQVGDAFHAAVTGWRDEAHTARHYAYEAQGAEATDPNATRVTPRPPPIPTTWRERRPPRPDLQYLGAGLGLFGLRRIPLVDREVERNALWSALLRANDTRRPQVAVLRGPSGCGKSRLAAWLAERAHEVGAANVLKVTHGSMRGADHGLGPMLARVLGCLDLDRAGVLGRVERKLRSQGVNGEDDWHAITEWIAPASAADIASGVRALRFSSPTERWIVLARWLQRVSAERPVVLWLDDAQWGLDALQFAAWLHEEAPECRVLVVITAMVEALGEAVVEHAHLESLLARPGVQLVEVGPLPAAHRGELVTELLGLEGELARQVEARSAGNPLFAVQLVGDLVERDLLEPGRTGFRLRPGARLELPDTVHQVWSSRVERVLAPYPAEAAVALEIAAALGEQVRREEWAEVCAPDSALVNEDLLDDLLAHHLIEAHPAGLHAGFSFVHGMVRETLERRAREAGRSSGHHRRCAAMLQDRNPTDRAERLGRHLLAAGDVEAALRPLLTGARARVQSGDYGVAESLIEAREAALARPEDDDVRLCDGWLLRVTIAHRQVRYDEAEAWLERVERAAERHGWRAISVEASVQRGFLTRLRGRPHDALAALRAVVPAVESLRRTSLTADLYWQLAEAAAEGGELEAALEYVATARQHFQAQGDGRGMAACLQSMAEVRKVQGAHAEAAALMRRAHQGFEAVGYRWGAASSLNSLGDVLRYLGQLSEAEDLYRRSGELFRSIGSGSAVYPDYNRALLLLLDWGRAEEAGPALKACLDVFLRQGRVTAAADAHLALAGQSAAIRDWAAWDEHMASAQRLFHGTGAADEDTARVAEWVGDTSAAAGEPQRARVPYQVALDNWRNLDRADDASRVLTKLSEL